MTFKEAVLKVYNDRNALSLVILIFLSLVLVGILLGQFLMAERVPEGAIRRLMCVECGHKEDIRTKDLAHERFYCPKCGRKMVYAWRCNDCDYEFALLPKSPLTIAKGLKTMAKFRVMEEARRCPNCGSISVRSLGAEDNE